MSRIGERWMDIEALRTFVEVARAGGVSPAARRLGVSKSIVSRRLVRLEEDLGVQLVARSTRGAALTEAGLMFRDHAERICAEISAAKETILPTSDLRGGLRVAAPLSFGPTHFAPVLAQLALLYPRLKIDACYTDRYVDLIGERFDCAIRIGTLEDSNLIAKRIGSIFGQCVASPDYIDAHGSPATPEELLAHEAILQGTEAWYFRHDDRIITVHPQGRFKADSAAALVDAAVAGVGIARVPDAFIAHHIASGALIPVLTRYPLPQVGFYVVRPPSQFPSRKVRVLTEMLIACYGDMPQREEAER